MSDDALVERLVEQVADRAPIDWEALTPDLQASDSVSPDDLEALGLLRLLDELGDVNASLQRGDFTAQATLADLPTPRPATAADPDDTPASWGRYTIEEMVGRGGFGCVYRAWDPALQMSVAIKILHRRFSDERLTDRLMQEGRALAQVTHPNVVRVLNVEQHDGRFGLVMEYLRGETLDQMVTARGMLNHREATVIAEDICRALTAVHSRGLVHRDVKARNIIREHDGRFVLMDFGAGIPLTGQGQQGAEGTPLYMAPEALRGARATIASDVYAVGVLLFHLVTRRYPYEGHTVDDIRAAHTRALVHPLLSLRPELPQEYVKVVDRALAIDPRERFATPGALLQALLDARTPTNWVQVAARTAAGLAGLAVLMTAGGAISSGVFNAALGRQAYATEGLVDWFNLGLRSLVLPVVLTLFGVGGVGLLIALRKLATAVSPAARALDASLGRQWARVSARLRLQDPVVSSSWLVLLSVVAVGAVVVTWLPLLSAVMNDIGTVPERALSVFSEADVEYRTYFRMTLSVLAASSVTGWYGLIRSSRARGTSLPAWLVPTEGALLVVMFLLMQVPYRLVHDNDEFARATWQGQTCHVLGTRGDRALLFCPALMPRNRDVAASEVQVEPSAPRESLFRSFASTR